MIKGHQERTSVFMGGDLAKAIENFGMPIIGIAENIKKSDATVSGHKNNINKIPVETLIKYSALFHDLRFNFQAGAKIFGTFRPSDNADLIDKYRNEIHATLRRQQKEERERQELDERMLDEIETGNYAILEQFCIRLAQEIRAEIELFCETTNECGLDQVNIIEKANRGAG